MQVHLFENKSMQVICHQVRWMLQEDAPCLSYGCMCPGHTTVWVQRNVCPRLRNTDKISSMLLLASSDRSARLECSKILKEIRHQLTLVSSSSSSGDIFFLLVEHTKWPVWWQLTDWQTCWPGCDIPQASPSWLWCGQLFLRVNSLLSRNSHTVTAAMIQFNPTQL